MMRRRMGRPGLVGTMARTAVIAGTASTVSGNVQRRQMERAQADAAPVADTVAPAPAPPPVASDPVGSDDLIGQLEKLAGLRSAGVLDDAEFAAAKARLLGS